MSRKLHELAQDDLVVQPEDIGLLWVDKTAVRSSFLFDPETYNVLRKFTSADALSFTLPVPLNDRCCRVFVYMDLTGLADSVPSISVNMPHGASIHAGTMSGDTLAGGKEYVLEYTITRTTHPGMFDVFRRVSAVSRGGIFYRDAEGRVVVDVENIGPDGTVKADGNLMSDGTMQIDV